MAYMERLARNYDEVVKSTKSFSVGLNGDPRLVQRLTDFKVWYYILEIDAVGPSKFIGYRDMTAEFYLSHTGILTKQTQPRNRRLDGGATENRLKKWFDVTESGTAEYECVSGKVKELLGQWDKKPKEGSRYNVPSAARGK